MKKLTLKLENLQVETFETTAGPAGTRGTVLGNSEEPVDSEAQCNTATNTEGPTCGAEHTCGYYYETCMETYEYSCSPCDATIVCTGETCRPCWP